MIYQQLFERAGSQTPVRAGVIGTGQYATAIVTQATRDLRAGEIVGDDLGSGLSMRMIPAQPATDSSPLPYFMAEGNALRTDIVAGSVLTAEMIAPPPDSTLWSLRVKQDEHFFGARISSLLEEDYHDFTNPDP
jgi:predicted homoserine dehydrogenase-like protein